VYTDHVEWLCGITPAPCQIASTPYHECTQSHQLGTMNDRGYTNSVPWMIGVTLTPYHEWPGSHHSVPWMHAVCRLRQATFIQTNCVHSWYGVGVTPVIYGTELMRFCKVALRNTKIRIKWLWPVNVTSEIIKWRLLVFCWSCDEIPLKWEEKNFRASSLWIGIEWDYSWPPSEMIGQCL
jgi:hypothetical protein